MKRILQQILVIALLAAGGICTTAQAQYPNYTHRNRVVYSGAIYGGTVGYSNGYSPGYGYANNYGGYNSGYGGGYYGFAPVVPLYPQNAPYGAGYSGGWRPYQDMYLQRVYYGLGF